MRNQIQPLLRLVVLSVTSLALVATADALPIGGPLYGSKEGFEGYQLGTAGPDYNANWSSIDGVGRIIVEDNRRKTGDRNLWIVDSPVGISYDLAPDFQAIDPTKNAVNGTDADPLEAQFWMHSKGSNPGRKFADFFVELSMGGVHAPMESSAEILPVLAYGWTRGINGSGITPWFFDGMDWLSLGTTDQSATWNRLQAAIKSDTVEFRNLQFGDSFTDTKGRKYLGPFDTISLRSLANADKERAIDDVSLLNGVLVSESSLLSDLTGNGFVDFEDLTVLLANWNKDVTAAEGNLVEPLVTVVNFDDLTVLLAAWTGPGPAGSPEAALGAQAVPEPSTLALASLLAIGWAGCGLRRRGSRRYGR